MKPPLLDTIYNYYTQFLSKHQLKTSVQDTLKTGGDFVQSANRHSLETSVQLTHKIKQGQQPRKLKPSLNLKSNSSMTVITISIAQPSQEGKAVFICVSREKNLIQWLQKSEA